MEGPGTEVITEPVPSWGGSQDLKQRDNLNAVVKNIGTQYSEWRVCTFRESTMECSHEGISLYSELLFMPTARDVICMYVVAHLYCHPI